MKRHIALSLCVAAYMGGQGLVMASAPSTTNVPVDSHFYEYIDKLSGMGYIEQVPTGAKPYSRMQMAKWTEEVQSRMTEKAPAYLQDMVKALGDEYRQELYYLHHGVYESPIALRSATAEVAYVGGYGEKIAQHRMGRNWNLHAHWGPFSDHKQGLDYSKGFNAFSSADVSGNVHHKVAVHVRPELHYTKDDQLSGSLQTAYVKAKMNRWALDLGKQSMLWGQGHKSRLVLGDSAKPLMAVRFYTEEPYRVGGAFSFLGNVYVNSFYGKLESNRSRISPWKDFDDAGLLGVRVDLQPSKRVNIGLSRVSMIGGRGNGLSKSDWRSWFTGKNAYHDDRWNDLAGIDVKVTFPGAVAYGEAFGEDQAKGLPSKWGYRAGVYVPKLDSDGSWDLRLETAKTNRYWYVHEAFQNGWTYHGHILGDSMGPNAKSYYVELNHYLPKETKVGGYYKLVDRSVQGASKRYHEMGLMMRKTVKDFMVEGNVGYAKVMDDHAKSHHVTFVGTKVKWQY